MLYKDDIQDVVYVVESEDLDADDQHTFGHYDHNNQDDAHGRKDLCILLS